MSFHSWNGERGWCAFPLRYFYAATVALSCTGIYTLDPRTVDLLLAAVFGGGFIDKTTVVIAVVSLMIVLGG
jgi:hypothetical protein